MTRILLGQLGSNGDCLYATVLARQLRQDYPDSHITWAISSQCSHLLKNNPHVDDVWELQISGWDQHEVMWKVFEREAFRKYQRGEFDFVLMSQISPSHFENYDGTVRPSILRSYHRPITVPIESVINLTAAEVEAARKFVESNRLLDCDHRILFECSSKSGQSFVTPDLAQVIARQLYEILPNCTVIFSTHLPMNLEDARSRYAGTLSLREIAALTHDCTLFVGSGSGGTVAASSTASKPLPMLQLLLASTSVFASFAHDFEYFGVKDRPTIEITSQNVEEIARCIAVICKQGVESARHGFDARIPVKFSHYFSALEIYLLRQQRYLDAARSIMLTANRYGWCADLAQFAEKRILQNLRTDPGWLFASNRPVEDRLVDGLSSRTLAEPRQVAGGWWKERRESGAAV